ncbi:hypothetical protein [Acetobacter conturbans]|uniref:Uncharacterized protein n=1 Tax=Acetobacter conturbans TaxID=1737472 RepID=A0ABX0K4S3_9PROT|nr:hypothetical protein [Acetobacter conturbans]NHN90139.1 hypothetical protein [Acetobacter conturbans]
MSDDGADGVYLMPRDGFSESLACAEQSFVTDTLADAVSACSEAFEKWPDIRHLRAVLLKGLAGAPTGDRRRICDLLLRTEMRDDAQDADIATALFNERRFEDALPLLRNVVRRLNGERFSAWNYICSLEQTGRYDELIDSTDLLDDLAAPQNGRISLYSQMANAKLAKAFSREDVVRDMRSLETSPLWLAPHDIAERVKAVIREGSPFAVTTFGYAEARMICATSLHASLLLRPAEIVEMADTVWRQISGKPFEECAAATLARLGKACRDVGREPGVLCLPGSGVLTHDNQHFGFFAEQDREVRTGRYAPFSGLDAMAQLAGADPGLKTLLGGLPFAGVVTDISGLAARIAGQCDFAAVTEVLLEQGALEATLKQFDEIWVPYPGAVFLVAATALGPYACARITAAGGIALDVGTCVPTWDD